MRSSVRLLFFAACLATVSSAGPQAWGLERFPPPEFESGYQTLLPELQPIVSEGREWLDLALVFGCLCLATWLTLRSRSRRAVFGLSLFSLVYFGFIRKGCLCPIGATQNVVLAWTNDTYAIPLTGLILFALPLAWAGLFGRAFCAGVCPLGAVQDLVLIAPRKVPRAWASALGLVPYAYLSGAAILVAVNGSFVICRYDPFVSFFRLSGSAGILLWGAGLLILSTVIGRPYCRFLCPYSVLLNLFSRWSYRHATISPDRCIVCGLCEEACPFGAILPPTPASVKTGFRAPRAALLALPFIAAMAGYLAGPWLSQMDKTARLAEMLRRESSREMRGQTIETRSFWDSGGAPDEVFRKEKEISSRFRGAGALFAGVCGVVVAMKGLSLSGIDRRDTYEMDSGSCLSCGRCFSSCPRERIRTGQSRLEGPAEKPPVSAQGSREGKA